MNTIRSSSHLALPVAARASADGQGAEFIFPPPKSGVANLTMTQLLWLAVVVSMAAGFVWACWNFSQGGSNYSAKSLMAVIGMLGISLAATGVAAGAALWNRHAAAEGARLAEANARLLQERDLLRAIINNLPDNIYAKDKQGRFVFNNPAHAKSLGASSPAELKGKSDFDFHPRELAEQFFADEQKIIATGESVINQEQLKSRHNDPSGNKRWSIASKVIWRDSGGEVLGTVGLTRDIHEFKMTQEALHQSEEKLRQFSAQLERSNRELQDFAYVASHDLQEPLRKIIVFGERLKEKCGAALDAEPRDYVERMQRAATRMQTLINDLLTFSRVTTKANPFVAVNLAEIARDVLDDLEGRIEQVNGRVEVGELPVIDADGLQMRQLIQNLVGNALKFRKPDELPVVKVAARKIPGETGREMCELTVSDNGIGFDEKYLDRIFNVFQRLHSRNEYEGTGMGLAIVRKIAQYHGGDITAKSRPGHGAAFIVTLPATHPRNENNQPTDKS
jgi:PAS domain S-box-containing protein